MTSMAHNFSANETWDPFGDAGTLTDANEYGVSMSNDFGGGTLRIERFNIELNAWVFASTATEESGIRLAVGLRSKFRFTLSGSTAPDLDVSFWPIA